MGKRTFNITKRQGIEIVEDYMKGRVMREIGKKYKVTRETIRTHLKRKAGKSRPMLIEKLNFKKKDWTKLNELRKGINLPIRTIASRTRVTEDTVGHIFCGTNNYINTPAAQRVFAYIMEETQKNLDGIYKYFCKGR